MTQQEIMNHIFKMEGGYSNHPNDNGGATNWGIIQATLSAYRGYKVTIAEVKALTKDEATLIYIQNYWNKMGLGLIKSGKIQLCIMDQGVNKGTRVGVKLAQNAANALGKKLKVDGVMGPATSSAVNSLNEETFLRKYIQTSRHGYIDICVRNPSQLVFLKGWTNRLHRLEDLVAETGS